MKPTQTLLAAAILSTGLLFATGAAQATLIPALGGQVVNDTDLNLTWLANANLAATNTFGVSGINPAGYMTLSTAQGWISAMNVNNYLGYNDWRLPATLQPDASCGSQSGGVSSGYNCTGSEMGHLFYKELGGLANQSITARHNANYSLFQNVQSNGYLSDTSFAPYTGYAWSFDTDDGSQNAGVKLNLMFALAVRPRQVAAAPGNVPEPATLALLGMGLAGMGWARRR